MLAPLGALTVKVPPPWTANVPAPSMGALKVDASLRLMITEPALWIIDPAMLPAPAVVPLPARTTALAAIVVGPLPKPDDEPGTDPTSWRTTVLPVLIVDPPV